MFTYKKCDFRVQKAKECTARVVVCKELKVRNSYTMEISFCGQVESDEHFSLTQLLSVGESFGLALIDLYTLGDGVKLIKEKVAKAQAKAHRLAETNCAGKVYKGNTVGGIAGRRSAGGKRKRRGGRRLRRYKRNDNSISNANIIHAADDDNVETSTEIPRHPMPPNHGRQRKHDSSSAIEMKSFYLEANETEVGIESICSTTRPDRNISKASDSTREYDPAYIWDEDAHGDDSGDDEQDSLLVALDSDGTVFTDVTVDEILAYELDVVTLNNDEKDVVKHNEDEIDEEKQIDEFVDGEAFGVVDEDLIDDLIYSPHIDVQHDEVAIDEVAIPEDNCNYEDLGSTGTGGESAGDLSDAELVEAMRSLRPVSVNRPSSATIESELHQIENCSNSLGSADDIDTVFAVRPEPRRSRRREVDSFAPLNYAVEHNQTNCIKPGVNANNYLALGGRNAFTEALTCADCVGEERLRDSKYIVSDGNTSTGRLSVPLNLSLHHGTVHCAQRQTFLPFSSTEDGDNEFSRSPYVSLNSPTVLNGNYRYYSLPKAISSQTSFENVLKVQSKSRSIDVKGSKFSSAAFSPLKRQGSQCSKRHSEDEQEQQVQRQLRMSKNLSGVGSRILL